MQNTILGSCITLKKNKFMKCFVVVGWGVGGYVDQPLSRKINWEVLKQRKHAWSCVPYSRTTLSYSFCISAQRYSINNQALQKRKGQPYCKIGLPGAGLNFFSLSAPRHRGYFGIADHLLGRQNSRAKSVERRCRQLKPTMPLHTDVRTSKW